MCLSRFASGLASVDLIILRDILEISETCPPFLALDRQAGNEQEPPSPRSTGLQILSFWTACMGADNPRLGVRKCFAMHDVLAVIPFLKEHGSALP